MENKPKTIFISGVFDVLHYGHARFFKQAKEFILSQDSNGKLIVATHDDASIKAKKGPDRPINPLEYRKGMLEAIKYIDEVHVWEGWENIAELVKQLKPDYIAVSGDAYKAKSLLQVSKELNIEVIEFPLLKGLSTSHILELLTAI